MYYQKSRENAFLAGKKFYEFIKSQRFSLPNTTMKYLWKYPSNLEIYKKLIQSCKFFFAKNPILICPSTFRYVNYAETPYWQFCSTYHHCFGNHLKKCFRKNIILEKMHCKLWLIGRLYITHETIPQNLFPKIYRSDAKIVRLHSEFNYISHVLFLASSAKELSLTNCVLKDDNGNQIFFEDFIQSFCMLEKFCIYWNTSNISPCKSYANFLRSLQKLPNFQKFIFEAVPDNFDIQIFLKCVKQLQIQFQTQLFYMEAFLPEIDNSLEEIVDHLIQTKTFNYCPTLIWSYNLEKLKPLKYFTLEEKIDEYLLRKA